jgi:type II secretory pathway pseudopilin PulG
VIITGGTEGGTEGQAHCLIPSQNTGLAVLVAIAVPRLIGFVDRGGEEAAKATARTLNSATTIFEAEGGTLVSDESQMFEDLVQSNFVQTGVDLETVNWNSDDGLWTEQ